MTKEEFREARKALGLTGDQMAAMLGYTSTDRRGTVSRIELGRAKVRSYHARLVDAYLAGYRPPDWPAEAKPPQEPIKIYAPVELHTNGR